MGKMIEFLYSLGFSLTNSTLIVVYSFMIAAIAIKILYFIVNVSFLALSIIRMKDSRSNPIKKALFKECAAVASFCILVQILVGYNAIQTMMLEYVFIKSWAKDGVVLWDMIRDEWESDWKPFFKLSRNG